MDLLAIDDPAWDEARVECRKHCNLTGTYEYYGKVHKLFCYDQCRGTLHWLRKHLNQDRAHCP